MHSVTVGQDKSATPDNEKPEKVEKNKKVVKPDKSVNDLAPITLEDLAINFPDVEGWEKGEIQKYPTEDLGFSINYESKTGGRVTIYVYDAGRKKIASDLSDKVIKDEFSKAKSEIQKVAEMGYYKELKELKNDTVTLGGTAGRVKALRTLYNFNAGEKNLNSEIYIFGHQDKFIKIRATRSPDKDESGNKMVLSLLKEIDAFYSK